MGHQWLLYIDDVHDADEILDELGDLVGLAGADGLHSTVITEGHLLFTSRDTVRWPPAWHSALKKIVCLSPEKGIDLICRIVEEMKDLFLEFPGVATLSKSEFNTMAIQSPQSAVMGENVTRLLPIIAKTGDETGAPHMQMRLTCKDLGARKNILEDCAK